jgi:branched-chain amino acid aminotransferase
MGTASERTAYHNGRFQPESVVLIPFRDRSFRWGDGCYDQARTFRGKIFKLRQHVDRLYRSLKYLQIDPGLSHGEMMAVSEEVVARNRHLLGPSDDYWVVQRVSRGLDAVGDEGWDQTGPTVIVECIPLPFKERAPLYSAGIRLETSTVRRTPPVSLSPRAKLNNYLNHFLADSEVKGRDPAAWALFLDVNGNIAEGTSNNVFLVRDGALFTPRRQFVLNGVSRETVLELAAQEGIPAHEADLDVFDARTADEMFLSLTSLCICPVSRLNGAAVGDGHVPGPTTRRLMAAFARLVDCDFVAQYESHLAGQ